MRVDRYALDNFGSWGHVVYEPGDAKLCIIQGANGVGKTTLVSEALGHALYKDDRGSVNGGVRIGQTDSAVSIEFTFNGARYRAIRRRTTKGAGKSSADLQVQADDGSWTPIASGDKEVPAEVRSLLRMDAPTFRTSVSLAQKDLDRFVRATAAGRKEILAAIVVDPRFKPAAELAGRRARDLEATTLADRSNCERLNDAIAELEPCRAVAAARVAEIHETGQAQTAAAAERDRIQARLTALATEIAKGDAASAEVAQLEAERTALGDRYRREQATVASAKAVLEGAAHVATAAAVLPEKRATLDALVEAEVADRGRVLEIADRRKAFDPLERDLAQASATWTADLRGAQARVTELVAGVNALEPVICRKCGTANVVDQADLTGQLAAARIRATEIETGEPKETMSLSRERVAIKRLEERLAETPFDRLALVDLQRDVNAYERVAARGEAIEAAAVAKASAEAELASIDTTGKALAKRLEVAKTAAAGASALVEEQGRIRAELQLTAERIRGLEMRRLEVTRGLAQAEANVARLEQLTAERDAVAARLAVSDVLLGRLRKLASAFGLKGIPARVIESVLPELRVHANDVLSQLFGMTLDIRAQRASADGKATIEALELVVTKDGIGEIEDERLSGGEGTAVSLALAIGLSRLNARRAGTAIRTMVLDEPDGLDVIRLQALGRYLRKLVHEGEHERIVAITHTEVLAEFGDRVDRVVNGPDGVELQRVA